MPVITTIFDEFLALMDEIQIMLAIPPIITHNENKYAAFSILNNVNANKTTTPADIEVAIGLRLMPRNRSIFETSYPETDAPNVIRRENQIPPRKIKPTTIGSAIDALRSRSFKGFQFFSCGLAF